MVPLNLNLNTPGYRFLNQAADVVISTGVAAIFNTAALLLYTAPMGYMEFSSYGIGRVLNISVPYGSLTGFLSSTVHSLIPNDSPLKTSPKLERSISAVISVVSSLLTLAVIHAAEYGNAGFEEQAAIFTTLTLSAFVAIQFTKYLSRIGQAPASRTHSG